MSALFHPAHSTVALWPSCRNQFKELLVVKKRKKDEEYHRQLSRTAVKRQVNDCSSIYHLETLSLLSQTDEQWKSERASRIIHI